MTIRSNSPAGLKPATHGTTKPLREQTVRETLVRPAPPDEEFPVPPPAEQDLKDAGNSADRQRAAELAHAKSTESTTPPSADLKSTMSLLMAERSGHLSMSTSTATSTVSGPDAATPVAQVRGPRADFEPAQGVLLHRLASDLCHEFVRAVQDAYPGLVENSGLGMTPKGHDPSAVWMRDIAPIAVHGDDGKPRMVTPLSPNPLRSAWSYGRMPYQRGPSPDARLYQPPGRRDGGVLLDTPKLPLLLEGGNVVSSGKHVFLTDKVLQDNARPHADPTARRHLRDTGFAPRSADQVKQLLASGLNVDTAQIAILPSMPGEKTSHVDMYLMPLGENRVMIPTVPDEAFGQIGFAHEHALGRQVQGFLNDRAAQLEAMGYQVERLPMMPPTYLQPAPDRAEGWTGRFDSPANSALFDIKGVKKAFIPTFAAEGFPDGYRQLNARYADAWSQFFQNEGYDPVRIDATKLGAANGLFRCLSAAIPEYE